MKTTLIKNLLFSATLSLFVASCASTTANDPTGISRAAGDAAVDAATKKVDPITGAAVRQATGLGTGPVEQATTGALNKIGL